MNGAACLDVVADLDDILEHGFQIAGDCYLFDWCHDFTAFDEKAAGAAQCNEPASSIGFRRDTAAVAAIPPAAVAVAPVVSNRPGNHLLSLLPAICSLQHDATQRRRSNDKTAMALLCRLGVNALFIGYFAAPRDRASAANRLSIV